MKHDATASDDETLAVLRGRLTVISHKRHDQCGRKFTVVGGFATLKQEFARYVEEVHLCVPVFARTNQGYPANYPHNVSVVPLPPYESRTQLAMNLPTVIRTLWREIGRADLVYAMCPNDTGMLGLLLARLRRKPVFVSIDTNRAGKARAAYGGKWPGRVKAWLIERTVHFLLRRLASGIPGYVSGDLFLGPQPNWRQWVKTTVTSRELLPLKLPNPANLHRLRVVFIGRLAPEKNIPCLIRAGALVANGGLAIEVTIVGEGDERSMLERACRTYDAGFVRFAGPMDHRELRRTRLLDSDVLVLPSREERQGKVLLEAMAYSVPVIGARAGGIPSVIQDGETGLLFDPNSAEELAECLCRIARDGVLRSRLVERAYRFACANTLDQSTAWIIRDVSLFYGLRIDTHVPGAGGRGYG